MARRARGPAGFTLIEMMVAVLIATAGVMLAAKVGQVIVRQSAKGRQNTSFRDRTGLMTKQLRADIRNAGVGSTGAIAVDAGIGVWGQMAFATPAGFNAIPVVAGATNLAGAVVGGRTAVVGSDALQLVVPDPASAVRTQGYSGRNQSTIQLELGVALNCPFGMVYVVDHTAPTGAGRAQILFVANYPPNAVNTVGNLQFTVAPGSDVMCARVSTYWTDTTGWFHRSDITGPGVGLVNLGGTGPVFADGTNVATDALGPGVLDLQVAFRVSSEVYTQAGAVAPVNQPQRTWIYEGVAGNADARMVGTQQWFEVRMIRVNLLARNLRRIQPHVGGNANIPRVEDAAALPPIPLTRALGAEWVTATETLTNLRYFDLGAAAGVAAEPY